MRVLLSIKPGFAKKIFSGEKQYEYRRVIFKQKIDSIVVYSTSPDAKIIGEFEVEEILFSDVENIWKRTERWSGIDYDRFKAYFRDRADGYAIKIKRPKLYETPVNPHEMFDLFRAPQSFCYIE